MFWVLHSGWFWVWWCGFLCGGDAVDFWFGLVVIGGWFLVLVFGLALDSGIAMPWLSA